VFGVAPVQIHQARRGGNRGQELLNVEAEALKHTQLFEQFPFKTQDSFFSCHSFNCLFGAANLWRQHRRLSEQNLSWTVDRIFTVEHGSVAAAPVTTGLTCGLGPHCLCRRMQPSRMIPRLQFKHWTELVVQK
jgi:hypothetical protein